MFSNPQKGKWKTKSNQKTQVKISSPEKEEKADYSPERLIYNFSLLFLLPTLDSLPLVCINIHSMDHDTKSLVLGNGVCLFSDWFLCSAFLGVEEEKQSRITKNKQKGQVKRRLVLPQKGLFTFTFTPPLGTFAPSVFMNI